MYCKNSFKPTQIKNGQIILKDIFSERRYTNDKHMEKGFSYAKSFYYGEKGLYLKKWKEHPLTAIFW